MRFMITELRFSCIITNLFGNSEYKLRPVYYLKNNTESGP